jgi:hypothetical protein
MGGPLRHLDTAAEISNFSWDRSTFPETSSLLPAERNGNWRTATTEAIKHPSTIASPVNEALQRPQAHKALYHAAESAAEGSQEALNRAFESHDVPATKF